MTGGDRSKSARLAANERVNALSRMFMNLATALFAAVGARIYVTGDVDRNSLLWTFASATLIFLGMKVLDLLDAENDG